MQQRGIEPVIGVAIGTTATISLSIKNALMLGLIGAGNSRSRILAPAYRPWLFRRNSILDAPAVAHGVTASANHQ